VDLFRRALTVVERQPRADSLENPAVPLTDQSLISLLGAGGQSTAGKSVTEISALTNSAVYRSVTLISTTCAGLPMHPFQPGPGDVRVQVMTGPAAALIRKPHPDLTPLELWELVYGSLLLWGNAYLLKLRNPRGFIEELWWINPKRVKPYRLDEGPDTGQKRYVLDGNIDQPFSDARMLHIPGWGYDGVQGMSIIRMAREGIGLGMAAEEFGAKLFGSGSLAAGLLQSEQEIDQDEAVRLKKLWKLGGSGLDSAHDIRVIGSGAKFTQLTIPPEDAQFLQTREFQITEVARWFGLPPHLLGQTEKSTSWGTGIESQNLGLITYNLSGHIGRVEQRMTQTVQPEPVYIKVGLGGLLRGDSASRAEFYTKMFQLGAFSPNDIRRWEDLPPVEGGDVYYRPMNFAPLVGGTVPAIEGAPSVDPGTEPAADPVEAEANPSSDAAALAQKIYLAVGKVFTVDEARHLVASGAGITLAEVDKLEVFANMPPLPAPLADPGPADPGTATEPTEQEVPADA
jgi:HK97 family phage portal protein